MNKVARYPSCIAEGCLTASRNPRVHLPIPRIGVLYRVAEDGVASFNTCYRALRECLPDPPFGKSEGSGCLDSAAGVEKAVKLGHLAIEPCGEGPTTPDLDSDVHVVVTRTNSDEQGWGHDLIIECEGTRYMVGPSKFNSAFVKVRSCSNHDKPCREVKLADEADLRSTETHWSGSYFRAWAEKPVMLTLYPILQHWLRPISSSFSQQALAFW